jgi:hypothetical protein
MPVLQFIIVLIAAGVGLWLINKYIPMDGKIKKILNVVVVVLVMLWVLSVFGIFYSLSNLRIGS